ncbi:MAG: extracellular solute-binding protein [Actinomycetes bacterium]
MRFPRSAANRRATRRAAAGLAALALAATATGCGGGDDTTAETGGEAAESSLLVYSGRNEELVGPLLTRLGEATGTQVEVRYGDSSELAAQLLEEGDRTQADLFFSQDAGALGALAEAGRLTELPKATLERVIEDYRDDDDRWVATSARARVVAYDPSQAPEAASMTKIDQVLDPKYRGKVGYAPTNASFHAFVTALREDRGEAAAREWLTSFKENQPQAYERNGAVLEAVNSGAVALGLINHYYWHELVAEQGLDKVKARIRFLGTDDPGALINVAGVGVLEGTDQAEAAQKAVEFLVSDPSQQYFADETAEYPVVEGITTTKHDLVPLEQLKGSEVDLDDLDSLDQTLKLLDEVGLT